jgi:hypothetical protein
MTLAEGERTGSVERAERTDVEQQHPQRVRDGTAAERNRTNRVRHEFFGERNILQLSGYSFSVCAIVGTPDASSYLHDRRAPDAGRFSQSSSSPVPRCPATVGQTKE